jgi:lysophospholipase L1-like esterase
MIDTQFTIDILRKLLFIGMMFLLAGCVSQTAVSPTPTPDTSMTLPTEPAASTNTPLSEQTETAVIPKRYLALGDSYTIGEGVEDIERWPNQLVARLCEVGFEMADVEIIAKTGWTTADLAQGITDADPQGPYDLVTLLIGVNNQYRGLSVAAYRHEFVALMETAVAFAGGDPSRVIVLSIPDWGATPFAHRRDRTAIGLEIDKFNNTNRSATEALGAHYVDITPNSRTALDDRSLIADDFLHPSGAMYSEWVLLVQPITETILQK